MLAPVNAVATTAASPSSAAQSSSDRIYPPVPDPDYLDNCRRMLAAEQRKAVPDLLMVTYLMRRMQRYEQQVQQAF